MVARLRTFMDSHVGTAASAVRSSEARLLLSSRSTALDSRWRLPHNSLGLRPHKLLLEPLVHFLRPP